MTASDRTRPLMLLSLLGLACAEIDEPELATDTGTETQTDDTTTSETETQTETETGSPPADPPECGDGVLEDGEACDDGNAIDDDACTNACTLPTCGDGVVQPQLGETCDDGNLFAADGCGLGCQPSGTPHWSRVYDPNTYHPHGRRLALADTGELAATAQNTQLEHQLISFDRDGVPRWTASAWGEAVAIGTDETYAVGGRIGAQAHTRVYNHDGDYVWSHNLPIYDSEVHDLAIDPTNAIVAAGRVASDGFLIRYAAPDEAAWTWIDEDGAYYEAVAQNPSGTTWALRRHPHRVESHDWSEGLRWRSALLPTPGDDLALDAQDSAYILGHHGASPDTLTLTKLDAEGQRLWTIEHLDDGSLLEARHLAPLPHGGALIVGSRAPLDAIDTPRDAIALWFDVDGELVHEQTLHATDATDADDRLCDVVVAHGYAVAVGQHQPTDGPTKLWLTAFEL